MSVAMIIPAIYSMIIIQFNEKSDEFIGLATSANTFGLMFGPFLGNMIF
jgi:hypothetical protein